MSFPLGQILITPGARDALAQSGQTSGQFLARNCACDWGEVSNATRDQNNQALVSGDRLHSIYSTSNGAKLWVITEADRSVTTLLLPDEY